MAPEQSGRTTPKEKGPRHGREASRVRCGRAAGSGLRGAHRQRPSGSSQRSPVGVGLHLTNRARLPGETRLGRPYALTALIVRRLFVVAVAVLVHPSHQRAVWERAAATSSGDCSVQIPPQCPPTCPPAITISLSLSLSSQAPSTGWIGSQITSRTSVGFGAGGVAVGARGGVDGWAGRAGSFSGFGVEGDDPSGGGS
jgi:hypothetical protein